MRKLFFPFAIFIFTGALFGQKIEITPELRKSVLDTLKVSSSEVAVITMKSGEKIYITLFPADAPNTVKNFIMLANLGFYDNLKFHRVIEDFVVQGGDPLGNGTGGAGYDLNAEFNNRKHLEGAVAMARAQDPNSASSQFYICLKPQPTLDGKYTVFGQVINGMDVVKKIKVGDEMQSIKIEDEGNTSQNMMPPATASQSMQSPVVSSQKANNVLVKQRVLPKVEGLRKNFNVVKVSVSSINLPDNIKTPISQVDNTLNDVENTLLGISSKEQATNTLQKVENIWAYLITFELLSDAIVKTPEVKKALGDCDQNLSDIRIGIKTVLLDTKLEESIPDNLKLKVGKTKAYIIVIEDLASKLGISGSIGSYIDNMKTSVGEVEDALWGITSANDVPKVEEKINNVTGIVTLCKLASSLGKKNTASITKAMEDLEETLVNTRIEIKKNYLK